MLLCFWYGLSALASHLFAGSLPALDAQKLYLLDTDQGLSEQCGQDRLSKWMVKDAKSGDENILISQGLLEKVIVGMIERGGVDQMIAADLKKGDDLLRNRMARMLATFNFSNSQVQGMINAWATNGPDQTMKSLLASASTRPEALAELASYLRESDSEWVKVINGTYRIVMGSDPKIKSVLLNATLNSARAPSRTVETLIDDAAVHVSSRFDLCELVKRVTDARGALARVLLSQPLIEDSFYESAWKSTVATIAADPVLVNEYAKRSAGMTSIYNSLRVLASASLRNKKEEAIRGMVKGASIPDSRFAWMKSQLEETKGSDGRKINQRLGRADSDDAIRDVALSFANKIDENEEWGDFYFWHLTRVAEAVIVPTKGAVPLTLDGNVDLASEMIKRGSAFGDAFESKLMQTDAYQFYPEGAPKLRDLVMTGEVDTGALQQYIHAMGVLLASDDDAWAEAVYFTSQQRSDKRFLLRIVAACIDRDVTCAGAWAQTIYSNDENLKSSFLQWLVESRKTTDLDNARNWLQSVVSSFSSAGIVGNPEVANFKAWFGDFISKDPKGQEAALLRIRVESSDVPYRLRQCLISTAVGVESKKLWSLFRMICHTTGDELATIRPRSIDFIRSSGLSELVLDEVAAQNPFAADASVPVWDTMFKLPEMQEEVGKVMIEGRMRDPAYGVGIVSLIEMMKEPETWQSMEDYAFSTTPGNLKETSQAALERLMGNLLNNAQEATPFIKLCLEDEKLKTAWTSRVLTQVKFYGKAYTVAGLVKRSPDLSSKWKQAIINLSDSDGRSIESMVESLTSRRIGDPVWMSKVTGIKRGLAGIIFNDRILFEQILADRNKPFRASLNAALTQNFGTYVSEQWF